MRILGLDVETTGLCPIEDEVTEIGAVLWDTETKKPLALYSTFVQTTKPISNEITELTGITKEMCDELGVSPMAALGGLLRLARKADCIVAHNAKFDKGFFDALCIKHSGAFDKQWVCTIQDIDYPKSCKHKNLTNLAGEHDFVNPFKHRALFDVLTMLRILSHYDIEKVLENARMPKVTLRAVVSFDEKDKAKAAGYQWFGSKKLWLKEVRQDKVELEKEKSNFQVIIMPQSP